MATKKRKPRDTETGEKIRAIIDQQWSSGKLPRATKLVEVLAENFGMTVPTAIAYKQLRQVAKARKAGRTTSVLDVDARNTGRRIARDLDTEITGTKADRLAATPGDMPGAKARRLLERARKPTAEETIAQLRIFMDHTKRLARQLGFARVEIPTAEDQPNTLHL